MIKEYMVVDAEFYQSGQNTQSLVQQVNEYIKEGWKPLGGVTAAIKYDEGYTYYYLAQAMVRTVD